MNPFRYLLKVGIAALAFIPAVLSAQQVATKFLVTEAGGSDPLGTTSWISGVTSSIRITALDDTGAVVTGYARDVTVTLPDPYTSNAFWVSVTVPAASFVSGQADNIDITPIHSGTNNRRIAVTDGNIATYNANNNLSFSISPASFFAARAGSYRGLSRNIVVVGDNLTRIIALNDDFSIAEAYTGTVTISSTDLDSAVDAEISFGGVAEDVSLSFKVDGTGQSIDITDGVTTTVGASSVGGSGVIDVRPLTSTGGIAAALNVSTTGSVLRPGGNMNVSFELKATAAAPIDSTDPIGTLSTVTLFNSNYSVTFYANSSVTTPGSGATNGSRGSVVFTVPDYFAPGAYTLRINTGLVGANTDTSITIGGAPDLAIQRFDYAPGAYEAGEAIRFDMVWRNLRITTPDDGLNSRVPASQRYRTELHLSTDDTFGNTDDILVWVYLTSGNDQGSDLLPGQSVSLSGEFTLPENLPGTYYLFAKVNSEGGRGAAGAASFSAGFTEVVGPTPPSVLSDGNNIVLPSETQKLTILPRTSTETTRLSLTSDGASSQGNSDLPAVAANASYVAFQSLAPLAGAGTSNGFTQIFRKNPSTGAVELVSVGTSGSPANGASGRPSISADGRYIVFESAATNLQPGDTNGFSDIYLRDMQQGVTRRLSMQGITQANSGSFKPSISANGRFVVFTSTARNLASGTTAGLSQVYIYDRDITNSGIFDTSGNTSLSLVSQLAGAGGTSSSFNSRISADGNYVVFSTKAANLLGGSSSFSQIVRWDRLGGTFVIVSTNAGARADGDADFPVINSDGSKIAFVSRALNLTSDTSTSGVPHVFRSTVTSGIVTQVIRINGAGNVEPNNPATGAISSPDLGSFEPSISADGNLIAYASESNNLLPSIPVRNIDRTYYNSANVYNFSDQNGVADVYLADVTDPLQPSIKRASVSSFGYEATIVTTGTTFTLRVPASRSPSISPDGRFVVFASDGEGHNGLDFGATNFDYSDTNGSRDIYMFDRKSDLGVPTNIPTVLLDTAATITLTSGGSITLSAIAQTTTSAIARVEFFANNIQIGVANNPVTTGSSRFNFDWTVPVIGSGNTSSKLYEVVAVAVDTTGARSLVSNLSRITVNPIIGTPPTVTVSAPTVALNTSSVVSFKAVAGDSEGPVSSVAFYLNGESIGAGDYSATSNNWTSPVINFIARGAGTYSITAVAVDSDGNQTTSTAATFTVTTSVVDSAFGAKVNEVFFAALGRNATDSEQQVYFGQLGATAEEYVIAAALMQTTAFDSTGAIVINSYLAVFGEYPTFAAFQDGLAFINAGGTTAGYIDSLYASGTYIGRFGALPSFSTAANVERFAVTVHSNLTGVTPSAKIKGTALTASDLNLTAAQLAEARKSGSSERSIIVARFSGLGTNTTGSVVASYILSLTGTTEVPAALLKRARVAGVILALTEPDTAMSLRETSALSTYDLLDVAELYGTGTTDAAIKPIFRQLPTSTSVSLGSELKFTAIVISPALVAGDITSNWTFNRNTTLGFGTAVSSQTPVHTFTYTVAAANTGNAGTYGLSVSNRSGTTAAPAFTSSITPIVPASLPGVVTLQVGVFYSVDLGADVAGMSYVAKKLPKGLVLNAATGVISGVPTKTGSFTVEYNTVIGKLSSVKKRTTFVVSN